MRTFLLFRIEDETGVSGEGIVAEGAELWNGKCFICWRNRMGSVGIYDNIEEVQIIHGHNGKTKVIWDDLELTE